jgi:hypothetical protein
MLVSDFEQINRPIPAVRDELVASLPAWLAESAFAAYEEGERPSRRVFSTIGPIRLSDRVWFETLERPERCCL